MNKVSEIADFRNKSIDDTLKETFEILQGLNDGEILEIIISDNVDRNEIITKIEDDGNYRVAEVSEARSGIHIFIKVF